MLPVENIILTRYLYIKDEVKLSFLSALLEKSKSALFWAYELYYSGFHDELINYIWLIYYDFYAELNNTFEAYLLKKTKEWKNNKDPNIIGNIVDNLLIRQFNADIFILRQFVNKFYNKNKIYQETDYNNLKRDVFFCIDKEDYISLSYIIISNSKLLDDKEYCLKLFLDIVDGDKNFKIFKNIIKYNFVTIRHILLTKCILKISFVKGLKQNKSTYLKGQKYSIYETINNVKPYRVLVNACDYKIDEFGYNSLFELERDKYNKDIFKKYILDNWIYLASFSPVWFERIQQHNGSINYNTKQIEFIDDDFLEKFYDLYNYELDEQSIYIQDKLYKFNSVTNSFSWNNFKTKFQKNNIVIITDDEINNFNKVSLL
jgi:hypothetical protein